MTVSRLDLARAFAGGADATPEEVVKAAYALEKFGHEFWWGKDHPEHRFPSFVDWLANPDGEA